MALAHIDRLGAEFSGFVEPFWNSINDEHLCRATQEGAHRRQQPNGTCTVDDDHVARGDLGQLRRVIRRRKRVGEQHEVVFPPVAGLAGQPQAIRIAKRDPQ